MPRATPRDGSRRKRVLRLLWWPFPLLDQGMMDYALEHNWVVQSFVLTDVPEADAVSRARESSFDGILTQACREGPALEFCRSTAVPVVDLAEDRPELGFPRVLLDEVAIGRLVGEHFVERGYRHFAFCSAYSHYAMQGRLQGFRDVAEPVSETFHLIRVRPGDGGPLPRTDALEQELEHLPRPLAVMALDDFTAELVVGACEAARLLVPEQVSVVGCNNDDHCELRSVKMSSVDPDFRRQGFEAARLLDNLMAGQPTPAEPIRIPPAALGVRQSSDMFAIENISVARGVRYIIQQHGRPNLQVDDVALAAGVSRRHIEGLFRKYLGEAVAEYIRDMRVRQAKNRLAGSSAAVQDVGRVCGFRSSTQFSAVFRNATGMSPGRWRKKARDQAAAASKPQAGEE